MTAKIAQIRSSSGNSVSGGYYTVKEACRLLGIGNTRRVTGWLQGHSRSKSGPVISRSYPSIQNAQELSFLDLLETRFVDHFRRQGVSLQSLRKASSTLREVVNTQHPFATSNTLFLTDRKKIFLQTAEETQDRTLLDLVSRQYVMYETYEAVLARGISFHPASGIALEWRPKPKEFPAVALNPVIAFGQPAVGVSPSHKVPTRSLFLEWKAEDGSFSAVADWFHVPEDHVKEAIEFELSLPDEASS
jgi:uncharacterized protein (DUF433 family)